MKKYRHDSAKEMIERLLPNNLTQIILYKLCARLQKEKQERFSGENTAK